jgi:murein DD-endopeptidase MepM/ murein hydrolase activator NlpD
MSEPTTSAQKRLVPEISKKTIYLRDGARARVLTLSPRAQIAGATLGALTLVWTVSATAMLAMDGLGRLTVDAAEIAGEPAAPTASRIAELEAARARQALEALSLRHEELSATLAEKTALRASAEALNARLAELEAERARLASDASEARAAMAAAEAARDAAENENRELALTLDRIAAALGEAAEQRDDAVQSAQMIEGALGDLEAGVELERDRRQRLLAQIEEAAELSLGNLEAMLSAAGVDVDSVLENLRREYQGQGGPFIAAPEAVAAIAPPERDQALEVMGDLERVNLLRIAATRMPFARPVTNPRYTSGFGKRRDPFNGRAAQHDGLDVAGRSGTPILATADGVVTFAGTMRGYGRVIKVRHAFGFETVYAHLRRHRVRKGDRVSRGQRIGDMGNSGRSTGTHLHYEVRINDRPVDPMKFIEASRNVL